MTRAPSSNWELISIHEYLQRRPRARAVAIASAVASPIVGFMLDPVSGTIIGAALSVVSYYAAPHIRVRAESLKTHGGLETEGVAVGNSIADGSLQYVAPEQQSGMTQDTDKSGGA